MVNGGNSGSLAGSGNTAPAGFYPDLQPFGRGRIKVSAIHEIYYEQCGNPNGKPALILHGGPGGGISPMLRQMHDPSRYQLILFDQRGCGNSTPHAELRENTTWDLVADIERVRAHLGIERWQVVGGSWGSTLAIAYALEHRERVTELILRGIFTLTQREVSWFYQYGASEFFPEAWETFVAPIPEAERGDLVRAYHKRLTGTDRAEQLRCAKAWSQWEGATVSLLPDPQRLARFGQDHFALAFARIECHYFIHRGFFPEDGYLLQRAHELSGIPGAIIQGRYDVVTPPVTAFQLHRAWDGSAFEIVADAGHSALEPGIRAALRRATDRFA
jgi:proline iminopeptidase